MIICNNCINIYKPILIWFLLRRGAGEHKEEGNKLAAVQFQLLTSTILFVSREGFRRGCIRSDASRARVVTVAWLSVPAGIVMAVGACTLVLRWQRLDLASPYAQAILIHGAAAVVEMASEPLYILAQSLLLIRVRVAVEAAATLARCAVTYSLIVLNLAMKGGRVFAYAELAAPGGGPWLDGGLLRLCGAFAGQAVVMGQGDKLVLVLLESAYSQGVFGLVDKLGGLVVRMVLQPFEESAFAIDARARDKRGLQRILLLAIKLVNLLGLVFVVFGPPYSYLLLHLLYGRQWSASEAPAALACYCLFILALALNGITEAFLHAVATEADLARSNLWSVWFTACHMAVSVALIKTAGSSGLILANCCNMAMRIAYSLHFIRRYFQDSPTPFNLRGALPAPPVAAAMALCALLTHASEALLLPGRGGAAVVAPSRGALHVAAGAWTFERSFIREIAQTVRGPKESRKED
eukprot:jgi/Mesen1/10562/ME000843S10072